MSHRLNRRQAVTAAAASAASLWASAGSRACSQDAAQEKPWIDAHVHVWTPDVQAYPLAEGYQPSDMQPPSFTPQELMRHAAPCGVGRVVLIQMSYYGFDNRYMLEVMQQHPGVYSGVAIVNQERQPADAMRRLAAGGVRGFRIQPHDGSPSAWLAGDGMRQMWKTGADERLAMCCLINPEFLPSVDAMCRKFPETPVVIDHFARIGIDGRIRGEDLDHLLRLADRPNTYVKVSAYYALGAKRPPYADLGPMIRKVLDAFGAQRLMWASDCPFQVQGDHTYAASIDLIRSGLDFLSEDQKSWILRKTAEKVYF